MASTSWNNTPFISNTVCNTVNVNNLSATPLSQHLSVKQKSLWTTSALWVQSMKCWHVKSGLQWAGQHFRIKPQYSVSTSTVQPRSFSNRLIKNVVSETSFSRAFSPCTYKFVSCHRQKSVMIKSRKNFGALLTLLTNIQTIIFKSIKGSGATKNFSTDCCWVTMC